MRGNDNSMKPEGTGNTAMAPESALIVEDLPTSCDWLGDVLRVAFPGILIDTAPDLAGARAALAEFVPDLALVDLGLPDGSGVDLILALRREHPGCRSVVTTIYADDAHLFPALRAGAVGYLLKDQPQERLAMQLRGIAAGEPPLSPIIARRLLKVFEPEPEHEQADSLSPRERETLVLIAKGYRLNEVADCLGVTRNTAAGYIKSVYRKLQVSSRAEAALAAARMGLVRQNL
ncbi:LuxR family two component transcriptional regulator [Salinisphaera sp. PC39]|uniref:response regulator transcription factor n=1 Tax=Salinisphaera sp. PC39 TaxID=1304156 RepID=UPI003342C1D4